MDGFPGFQILIRLDHGAENEEYEEIIEFAEMGRLSWWIIWRDTTSVFVQPIWGKNQRSKFVAEALDGLLPKQRVVLTDIAGTAWPANGRLKPGSAEPAAHRAPAVTSR